MASNLANVLFSALGGAKAVQPAPAKPAVEARDRFAQLLDSQGPAPKPPENTVSSAPAAPANDQQPSAEAKAALQQNDRGSVAAETKTPEVAAIDAEVEQTDTPSLADALLAALAALGLQPETATEGEGEAVVIDPAALEDIKNALEDLSQVLGLNMTALVQQLTELAKGVAAEGAGGAGADLVSKLGALIGDKLGALNGKLAPDAEAALTKLMEGLSKLAEALPTEPELASAQLKLTEPVLAGKTASADAQPAAAQATPAAIEPKDSDSLAEIKLDDGDDDNQRTISGAKSGEAVADAGKPANQNQAARPNGAQDNSLNLTAAAASQADAATPKVDASAAQRVVQTGYQTSQQQLNLPQIAFEVSRQVMDGNSRFQIRLDPPELGRIDVKLDIDSNGQVHAKLTVEKAETLDLMQRDQRALERALQQAGLDQSKTNLEFSLKQNPFAGDQNQGSGSEQAGSGNQDSGEEADAPVPAVTLYRGNLSASGLNIIA